ncbi:MAG: hypothetical protein IPM39_19470 [Chloroflexi bacterium]|nr:hypothetical protein [Chloroflexota bacterium]
MTEEKPVIIDRKLALELIDAIITNQGRGMLWGINGLAKMGKTTLLKNLIRDRLETRFIDGSWHGLCAYLDLRMVGTDSIRFRTELVNSFTDFISHSPTHTDEQIIQRDENNLALFLQQYPDYQIVLLLDEINLYHKKLDDNPIYTNEINDLVADLIKNYGAIVIIAGRLPLQSDPSITEETRRLLTAWQEELNINSRRLDVFSEDDLREFFSKNVSSSLSPSQAKKDLTFFTKMTLGTPGFCAAIRSEKWRHESFDLASFTQRWLLGEVGDEEHQMNPPISQNYRDYYPVLQSLSVLRYFSPPLLERFLDEQGLAVRYKVMRELMKTELMIYESPKGFTLGVYRNFLSNSFKEADPERWLIFHQWAIQYYYNSAVRYRVNPITHLHEFLYHNTMMATLHENQVSLLKEYLDDLRTQVVLDELAIDELKQVLFDNRNELLYDAELREAQRESVAAAACVKSFVQWLDTFKASEPSPPQEPAASALDKALLPRFVGREKEKHEICHKIKAGRGHSTVLVVTGTVGVGKTALLQHVSEQCHHFADNQAQVLLAPGDQLFDFRLAELRHPRPVTMSIAQAISKAIKEPETFQRYQEAFRQGVTGHELNNTWLECYNAWVAIANKVIVICFDSAELLVSLTLLSDWAAYVFPRLENTVVILTVREPSIVSTSDQLDSWLTKVAVEAAQAEQQTFTTATIALKNFTFDETNTFLQPILVDYNDLLAERCHQLTAGHPLALTLLTRLSAPSLKKLLSEFEEPASGEQSAEPAINELLSQLGARLVEHIDKDFAQLLDFLTLARQGLTPKLLASLRTADRANDDDIVRAAADLQLIRGQLFPLIRTLYRQPVGVENASPDPVLIPHEAFLDSKDRHWSFRQSELVKNYEQQVVNYCRRILARTDINHPYYERWVFDTLFYLCRYDRKEGIDFLLYQQEIAWRDGRWDFVQQLEDEWRLLNVSGDLFEALPLTEQKIEPFWHHLRIRKHFFYGEYNRVLEQIESLPGLASGLTWEEQLNQEIRDMPEADGLVTVRNWIDRSQVLLSGIGVETENSIEEAGDRLGAIIAYNKRNEWREEVEYKRFLQLTAVADAYFLRGQAYYLQAFYQQALVELQEALQRYSELALAHDTLQTVAHITHTCAESGLPEQTHHYTRFAKNLCINAKISNNKTVKAYLKWILAANQYAQRHWLQAVDVLQPIRSEKEWPGWHLDWQMVSFLYLQAAARLNVQTAGIQNSTDSDLPTAEAFGENHYIQFRDNPNVWPLLRAKASLIWGEHFLHRLILSSIYEPITQLDEAPKAMQDAFADQQKSLIEESFGAAYLATMFAAQALYTLSIEENVVRGKGLLLVVQDNLELAENRMREFTRTQHRRSDGQVYSSETKFLLLGKSYYQLAFSWLGLVQERTTSDKKLLHEALEYYNQGISLLGQINDRQELIEPLLDQLWVYLKQMSHVTWQTLLDSAADKEELAFVVKGIKVRQFMDKMLPALTANKR